MHIDMVVCLQIQGGNGVALGRHLLCAAIASRLYHILLVDPVCEIVHVLYEIGPLLAKNEFGRRQQRDAQICCG